MPDDVQRLFADTMSLCSTPEARSKFETLGTGLVEILTNHSGEMIGEIDSRIGKGESFTAFLRKSHQPLAVSLGKRKG